MSIPIVAIIGLPNTGKSTFFNKVLGMRKALTYPEAGTTRDRHFGLTSWNGLDFYLVDTAGIVQKPGSELEKNVQKQTAIAKEEADLILLVVDGKTSPGNQDFAIAADLKRSKKPQLLVANKIDVRNAKTESLASEYVKLGLGKPFLISSVNGSGIGDLLDAIVEKLREEIVNSKQEIEKDRIKIAFLGKPNVGKSSLINALLKSERLLVHEKAGTTRSAVDIPFEYREQKFLLIDTAGIKKKWKQEADVETAAAFQSLRVLNQTDVALFVLDASVALDAADQAIAAQIVEANKSAVVVVNKTDLLTKEEQKKLLDRLPDYFSQLWWAPVVLAAALQKTNLDIMLKLAIDVYNQAQKQISQEELDDFLEKILETSMPGKMFDQKAPKLYNIKQVGTKPPTFKFIVNFPAAVAPAWKKIFEKQFRLKFGFEGTPIIINYVKRQ
ncbi:MAG: ribosome biogenesis GTPase Der [Candidatus Doudnabacteria bacterium]|nr:ribosome biogenesis GTPase Der [Candidatus Doudnabacteria bacterium]